MTKIVLTEKVAAFKVSEQVAAELATLSRAEERRIRENAALIEALAARITRDIARSATLP